MTPTIKDIAARAGISYATVSRALNGKYGVSQATRDKVMALAEEMGYSPNAIAQGLVNRATKTVGLVIPDITSPFFPRVALGVEDTMMDAGFSVFLCNTNWDLEREKNALSQLARKQVDGILLSTIAGHAEEVEKQISKRLPLVYLSSYPEGTERSYVRLDNIKGADMAVSHLLSRGRRRIAFIGSSQEPHSLEDRLEGYRKALKRAGLAQSEDLIVLGEFQEQSGYMLIRELFERGIVPDGVFAENDLIAMGVVQGVLDSGYRVPDDISVIGFDDIPITAHREIQLSTIHQPKYRIGQYAAEIMLHQVNQEPDERVIERKTLQPELIVRRSS
jgi:LacI family transcriptional regulator